MASIVRHEVGKIEEKERERERRVWEESTLHICNEIGGGSETKLKITLTKRMGRNTPTGLEQARMIYLRSGVIYRRSTTVGGGHSIHATRSLETSESSFWLIWDTELTNCLSMIRKCESSTFILGIKACKYDRLNRRASNARLHVED